MDALYICLGVHKIYIKIHIKIVLIIITLAKINNMLPEDGC